MAIAFASAAVHLRTPKNSRSRTSDQRTIPAPAASTRRAYDRRDCATVSSCHEFIRSILRSGVGAGYTSLGLSSVLADRCRHTTLVVSHALGNAIRPHRNLATSDAGALESRRFPGQYSTSGNNSMDFADGRIGLVALVLALIGRHASCCRRAHVVRQGRDRSGRG
jgi:hypothetical protein